MCVIVHQPKGTHFTKEHGEEAWNYNPDGGGFAFIDDDGRIQLYKNMKFEKFWRTFERARSDFPKRDFLLHMRIATHGSVCLENTHPFWTDEYEDTVMAHNGVIHNVPADDLGLDRSDTRMFIDEVLPELPDNWLDSEYLTQMVESYIGSSKLAFLTTNGKLAYNTYILNRSAGVEEDGMWYSNRSPIPVWKSASSYRWPDDYKYTSSKKKSPPKRQKHTPLASVSNTPVLGKYRELNPIDDMPILKNLREAGGLTKPIAFSGEDRSWQCLGCDETVDPLTGECECWQKICLDCESMAAECVCKQGWSSSLVFWDNAPVGLLEKAVGR